MRTSKNYFLPLVFGACLVAGLTLGFVGARQNSAAGRSALPGTPVFSLPTPPSNQLNILVIGVEQTQQPQTRLLSIWLVIVSRVSSEVRLLPIYPPASRAGAGGYSSAHLPVWVDSRSLAAVLSAELLAGQDYLWNEVLLLDRFAMVRMLELLGGGALQGGLLDQAAAVIALPAPWEEPQESLRTQAGVLANLCANMSSYSLLLGLDGLVTLPASHLQTSLDEHELLAEWERFVDAGLHAQCEFPLQRLASEQ